MYIDVGLTMVAMIVCAERKDAKLLKHWHVERENVAEGRVFIVEMELL